jgi:hypothetical protein
MDGSSPHIAAATAFAHAFPARSLDMNGEPMLALSVPR